MGLQNAPLDAAVIFSDITTNNASITKHGFLKKLPNDATKFLDGTGVFSSAGGSGLPLSASQYVIVGGGASGTINGTALLAAYVVAKTATPQGNVLSVSNRYTVFLLPGIYDFGVGTLTIDTSFIDIIGISTNSGQLNYGTGVTDLGDTILKSSHNVIDVSSGIDISIGNLCIWGTDTSSFYGMNTATQSAVFKLFNVLFKGTRPMVEQVNYGGIYTDVRSWEGYSFGWYLNSNGIASGIFTRCKIDSGGFGNVASGIFIDCELDGVGMGNGTASGLYQGCRQVTAASGSGGVTIMSGTFTGTAIDCYFPNSSLNYSSGNIQNCRIGTTIQNRGGNTAARHIIGISTAPTIVAGAGAGTSPTVAIAGTDLAGQITITSGLSPTINTVIVTVTFNQTYSVAPYIVLWPAEANASTLGFLPYVVSATTTFTVNNAVALGLLASTTYKYNYIVVQ